jgi:hypothetical protein
LLLGRGQAWCVKGIFLGKNIRIGEKPGYIQDNSEAENYQEFVKHLNYGLKKFKKNLLVVDGVLCCICQS